MMIKDRQQRILKELEQKPDITIAELASLLFVSEPTVRRDFTELQRQGLITKVYGGAILNQGAADQEIPFLMRENEMSNPKTVIAEKAARLIRDGMVIVLDGSTSAYHIVPFLKQYKDLIVVTSGAKTAVALAEQNIRTFSTGGQMIIHSFSYIGEQAESFIKNINADILFFSCHGVSENGLMTECSIEEANLRKVMFEHSKRKVLLCDSSKFGKTFFYNMGHLRDVDEIISEKPLPKYVTEPEK